MSNETEITAHYEHGELLRAIATGLEQLGKTQASVSIKDLAPVDEFHIGGRQASEHFLDQLNITAEQHLLDVGCGLGGTSRFVVDRYNCRVSGVDLSSEYIETGQTLCRWLGLDDRINLQQGSALSLAYGDDSFDGAYMMHVGMNIRHKGALFEELFRVLRPGSLMGIYDVMRIGEGELSFPLPWATTLGTSAVESADYYKTILANAGFKIQSERNRQEFALDFFKRLKQKTATLTQGPALGLHILMGKTAALKVKNMSENISTNKIAPVEIIVEKSM